MKRRSSAITRHNVNTESSFPGIGPVSIAYIENVGIPAIGTLRELPFGAETTNWSQLRTRWKARANL